MSFWQWTSAFVLFFLFLSQARLLILAVVSYIEVRSVRRQTESRRINDMINSITTPPVSVIIPAYNESAGIAESVRSMATLAYGQIEIVVVNDGSSDDTLEKLIEAFDLVETVRPFRTVLDTAPIVAVYESRLPLAVTVVDKENGGKGDALNAGFNVAKYPYVMATDADMILDRDCLLRMMRHVVEGRDETLAIGGTIRPANGSKVQHGMISQVKLPKGSFEMIQLLEYLRSFTGARPGSTRARSLMLISGALGVFKKSAVFEVGGYKVGHLGEDLEMVMRLHRHNREAGRPYRIIHAVDAVAWTEVPSSRQVLRRQRIRWHRGLLQVIIEYWRMMFNPRYGRIGLVGYPSMLLFEFLSPIVEMAGWFVMTAAIVTGYFNREVAFLLISASVLLGGVTTLVSALIDEGYGLYDSPRETIRFVWYALIEHLGLRQQTVWWRVRSMFWTGNHVWGDMQRTGVGNLQD